MLIWIIIVLIIVIYVLHYTKVNDSYNITQTYIENLTPEILREKHPIIVYDMVPSLKELLKTLFAYEYIFSTNKIAKDDTLIVNKSKYMLLHNIQNHTIDVDIVSPKYAKVSNKKDISLVTIKLKPNQLLILPFRWIYHTTAEIYVTVLDDLVSYLVKLFVADSPAI